MIDSKSVTYLETVLPTLVSGDSQRRQLGWEHHEISGISLDVGSPACCDHRVTLCCSDYTRGDLVVWGLQDIISLELVHLSWAAEGRRLPALLT